MGEPATSQVASGREALSNILRVLSSHRNEQALAEAFFLGGIPS